MERQRIKEAARLKIEWCCEIVGAPMGSSVPMPALMRVFDVMHNAQASYVRYVHGPRYRGPGEIFSTVTAEGHLRITMRWAGSKGQAHMLHRRESAFHAVGEEPTALLVDGSPAQAEPPDMVLAPIPASEGTGQPPEPGLEMQPPAEPGETPPPYEWPANVFALRRMARELNVDVTDIKGRGAYKKIIERLEAPVDAQE